MTDRPTRDMRWAHDAGTPASRLDEPAVNSKQLQGYDYEEPVPNSEYNEVFNRHGEGLHYLLTRTYDTVAEAAADVTSHLTQDGEVCFIGGSQLHHLGDVIQTSNASGSNTGEDVACDGRYVYAYYADGTLRAHDPADSLNVAWSKSLTSTFHKVSSAGYVLVATEGINVNWYNALGAAVWTPTALGASGNITDVFCDADWAYAVVRDGSNNLVLYQLDIGSGGINKSATIATGLTSDPIVCSDGRRVYVAYVDGGGNKLTARDPDHATLAALWSDTPAAPVNAFCCDGRWLLCANANGFDKRRAMDGTVMSSIAAGLSSSAAIAMDGRYVYLSRYDGGDARLGWWDLATETEIGFYEGGASTPDFGDIGVDYPRALACDGNDVFAVTPVATMTAALQQYSSGRPARLFRRSSNADPHRAPLYTILMPADPGV